MERIFSVQDFIETSPYGIKKVGPISGTISKKAAVETNGMLS